MGTPNSTPNGPPLASWYRLKYRGDTAVLASIAETVAMFLKTLSIQPDAILPMPPSKLQRSYQPVAEIASELSRKLQIPLDATSLKKTRATPQMKDVGDFSARVTALEAAFAVGGDL